MEGEGFVMGATRGLMATACEQKEGGILVYDCMEQMTSLG
jgi:hypothetical protein